MLPSRSRARGRAAGAGVPSCAGGSRQSCALGALQIIAAPGLCRQATATRAPGGAPAPAQGRADREELRHAPGASGLLNWGGAAAAKVAVAGSGSPDGEQTATHLSRVGRRVDSAPGLPPSGRGPRRVAGAPSFPRATGVTGPGPGWGTRSCARRRTRLSWFLVPSLAVSPNPAPALRPLWALGSHPGAQVPRRRERVPGCEGLGRLPPSPRPVRTGSAERNGAGRSAACTVPSLSERPPWRRGAVTQA
ncbi:hypothetical protein NN561_008920 [Cricetulus griseus]